MLSKTLARSDQDPNGLTRVKLFLSETYVQLNMSHLDSSQSRSNAVEVPGSDLGPRLFSEMVKCWTAVPFRSFMIHPFSGVC